MNARWICGLAVLVLLVFPCKAALADEPEGRISIGGNFRDDEPLESRTKRNSELRAFVLAAATREQPPLHLGDVVFELEEILPIPTPDRQAKSYSVSFFKEQPHVVQLKDDLALIENQDKHEWVARPKLVTVSQLEGASTNYLEKHPREAAAYAQRASFRAMGRRVDDALSDMTQALKLRPECVPFFIMRGYLWICREQHGPGEEDLDEAVFLDTDNTEVYLSRAAASLLSKDFEKALPNLNAAIRLGNKETDVFLFRGNILLDKENYAAAEEDFTHALKYLPADEVRRGTKEAVLYFKRACAYQALGKRYAAIAEFTLAIELEPRVPSAVLLWRGATYAQLGEEHLALADYDEAIRLEPEQAASYFHRGKLWFLAQEYDKANDDFSAAITRDPVCYEFRMGRAQARCWKKDFQGAIVDLTHAHFLRRDDLVPLEARARVYDELGETANANADRDEISRMKRDRASQDEFRKFLR
jgi:tetratricopeptide (TPR) repeat protein